MRDNNEDRIRIVGGTAGIPFKILIDGDICTRYEIKRRNTEFIMIDNKPNGDVYWLAKSINRPISTEELFKVKKVAVEQIAILEEHKPSEEKYPVEKAQDIVQEKNTALSSYIFGGTAVFCLLILFALYFILFGYDPNNVPEKDEEDLVTDGTGSECLSSWDGSSYDFERKVQAQMNDPESFEHVSTIVGADIGGHRTISMTFRGKNIFSGVVVNTADGILSDGTCETQLLLVKPGK